MASTIYCPAGKWTLVVWSSHLVAHYKATFSSGGVNVKWRRYSSAPPWYTSGNHNSSNTFHAWMVGVYCSFYFKPDQNITVSWGA